MQKALARARRWRFVWIPVLVFASLGLMAVRAFPTTYIERREAAQRVWSNQSLTSYRIVVRALFAGRACAQEIEVHGAQQYVLRDTCNSSWLSFLTVDRLFELGARLESGPECFPSKQDCVCHRVRIGSIEYDPAYGFPVTINWRREMQPNWQHAAYWKYIWEKRELPKCTTPVRPLRLEVVSLIPLEKDETSSLYHAAPPAGSN